MGHEKGMSVSYEAVSKTLAIFSEARKAGEEYCRSLGWSG